MVRPRSVAASALARTRESLQNGGVVGSDTDSQASLPVESSNESASNDLDGEDECLARSRRGRPRRGESTTPRKKYKTLTEFSLLDAGLNDLEFWIRCVDNARPLKRGIKGNNKGIGPSMQRPPVDVLIMNKGLGNDRVEIDILDAKVGLKKSSNDVLVEQSRSSLKITLNDSQYLLSSYTTLTAKEDENGPCLMLVGDGGISAVDWAPSLGGDPQLLVVAAYPTQDFADHWVCEGSAVSSPPIQIYQVSVSDTLPKADLAAIIRHDFGAVRQLSCSPFPLDDSSFALMTIFGSGVLGIFSISHQISGTYDLEAPLAIDDDKAIITTCSWCPIKSKANLIAVGYSNGYVRLWHLQTPSPLCIAAVRPTNRPITTVAFHPEDHMIVSVGMHDSPATLVDLRIPNQPVNLHSPASVVPLTQWSRSHFGCVIADSEAGIRILFNDDLVSRSSIPVGTFAGPVVDADTSIWHNMVAMAGSNGAVHFSVLDVGRRHIIFERRFLQCILTNPGHVDVKHELVYPKLSSAANPLSTRHQSVSSIRWSRSSRTPGLLAIGLGSCGLLILFPMDRLSLLLPD